uniref:Uncharacterized protein n=1 Tax=Rhizophora mucronata TaxID=61149 RepID=A0A2P2PFA2_RHIMU
MAIQRKYRQSKSEQPHQTLQSGPPIPLRGPTTHATGLR